jgi:hypothetical protein
MKFRARRVEEPEVNLISFIDVVLMIVIFFMLSSTFSQEGRLKIRLPEAGIAAVPRTTASTAARCAPPWWPWRVRPAMRGSPCVPMRGPRTKPWSRQWT